ncbi:MAG: DUF4153 domain-containing protein [Bacteroidales bacterium]|nr:DUF4153 domain-containing protein [Bacteroidales bacterium]
MKKISSIIPAICGSLLDAFRLFPLEAALGLAYFLLFVLFQTRVLPGPGERNLIWMFLWFFPHYVLVFTFRHRGGSFPTAKVLAAAAWLLWLPLVACPSWKGLGFFRNSWAAGIGWTVALILLFLINRPKDDKDFGADILGILLRLAKSFFVGGLATLIVLALIASVNYLFDLNLNDRWFSFPAAFILMVIMPLLCCLLVTEKGPLWHGCRFLKIVVDHILSPALVIYSIILYLYLARIIWHWELPSGGVAYMVLGFLTLGLLCHLMRLQVRDRHFEWFYKTLPFIAAAPLVLLWIGIARRVGEYGVTETRFFLIVLAALVTLFIILLLFPRSRNFRLMAVILAAAGVLFSLIPCIRAKDFGIRSQRARLENLLPEVLVDGRIPTDFDYKALSQDSLQVKAILDARDVWNYLQREMGAEAFKEKYGLYGDFNNFMEWKLRPSEYGEAVAVWNLEEPVDVGPYTELVPKTDWHLYEDREVVIFYKDSSKKDTLLVCPVKERLSSPNPSAKDILVYANDGYMVVFESISDYGDSPHLSFLQRGPIALFRKHINN